MGIIFDLDQTIIDSSIAYTKRKKGKWSEVYKLIPYMRPYHKVVNLIKELVKTGIEIAVVTSSPREYCERILNYLGITNVITVCYHDTEMHKPHPEPLLKAIYLMENPEKDLIVVGDQESDIIAAHELFDKYKQIYGNEIEIISILATWGRNFSYEDKTQPDIICRDEESLLRYSRGLGIDVNIIGLKHRGENIYQALDYYPKKYTHDYISEQILTEIKCWNQKYNFCEYFLELFLETITELQVNPNEYGIFVVPSSRKGEWNDKLMDVVVPKLISRIGLIDCSDYILRHTTHEKQAFGGDRSVKSNLDTIELQYELPDNIKGAFIIDDITTTGNIFEACRQLLCNEGISRKNIYCAAIAGTEHID